MMKMRSGTTATASGDGELELRPGGMVVQKRTEHSSGVPRVIRVRVKYGSVHHEISINSQSTFGELKKILSGATGVHHQDMKIIYKDKERDSKMFLDLSGVKDRSKLILKEDPISQEKRLLELRKIAAKEKSTKAISDISFQVERLAGQLSAFDSVIGKGGKVEEKNLENLMEMLMNQLAKLDAISGDGDVKLKKKMQEERLQKCIVALDLLNIKNSTQPQPKYKERDLLTFDEEASRKPTISSSSPPVIITTRWETFDSNSASTTTDTVQTVKPVHPKFKWELFN
ncbi:BAG family molecular chaperone regulator 2 isoform X1 [Arabidopsis lyrata subsp. lyrata]|nr:BAG family molecular chaperone regulator 2 isoform X1 [Arabidopsis lyrata subsp. lyrata]|eukprot:XP_020871894.1 BAG family molecular chaperone regulator 2 isoform X1 [Arabidopsis lyrata subsp. lyrata]